MNSGAADGRVSGMPRRRQFLPRPHDALRAATEAHSRLLGSGAAEGDRTTEEQAAPSAKPQSPHAAEQRRNRKGRFA